ncbi:MAG TPA: hypothetical protein DCY13_21580 [Verrucomicrobiales bacterium]|nr:hypothetical protein [Verrucomicrobiales bacterium]
MKQQSLPCLRLVTVPVVLALLTASVSPVRALIFSSTGDPSYNTTAPAGNLAGSGWQYQGLWNGFLGTPVSSRHFITARHIGGSVGQTFSFNGASYTTTAVHSNGTDLNIWEVAETFSTFAPLYTGGNETGRDVVLFGRGTQRGAEVWVDGELKGWQWGAADGALRWGENTVAGTYGSLIRFTFDQSAGGNEVHLSTGDSGGAIFIEDGGIWKLAGINYAVDGPWKLTVDGPSFNAAIFDRGGLYRGGTYYPDSPTDNPSSFYATPISANHAWISSVTLVPVPEPSVVGLLGMGAGVLAWRLIRRRGNG